MPNRFTGDSDAVLEVSQATFDRLLASMHQNAGLTNNQPTLPNATYVQLGGIDTHPAVDGVLGSARVQTSVPRLYLIDGATDRTIVETWIRARFRADPGSTPFPEFIYGVLRVQYMVEEIQQHARYPTALRLVIDPGQVSFKSAGPDTSHDAAITRQIVAQLQTRFVMTPHPLLNEFTQRRLKSLVTPPLGAVVSLVALSATGKTGDLNQVTEIFLNGKDFALAINRDFILSMIQPTLDALLAAHPKFTVSIKAPGIFGGGTIASGTYTVTITKAQAHWKPGTINLAGVPSLAGIITLEIEGKATTPSVLPNASFSLSHDLWVGFNAATESLFVVSSGSPAVSASVNGPFGGLLEGNVKSSVTNTYNAQLTPALAQAQVVLQSSGARKQTLITQLQLVDLQADAHFDSAEFLHEGVILRGTISLSPRRVMKVSFAPQDNLSGFTAFASWIPGGRIDKFDWRWRWFDPSAGPYGPGVGPDQTQSDTDRFVLETTVSLPGLPPVADDPGPSWPRLAGAVCLSFRGVCVNAVTGVEEPVDSSVVYQHERMCLDFYPDPPPPVTGGIGVTPKPRLWWKIWLASSSLGHISSRERMLLEVGSGNPTPAPLNHLIHYVDDAAAVETLARLGEALRAAGRDDTGLVITVVMPEPVLAHGGAELSARLHALSRHVGAPMIVTEDVQGGWSQTFGFSAGRGGSATRLVTADQRLAWQHDGPAEVETLTAALREHLVDSDPPHFTPVQPVVRVGEPAPSFQILTGPSRGMGLGRLKGSEVIVVFVQPWATPCLAQLRALQKLNERLESRGAVIVALVSGTEHSEVEKLVHDHRLTYLVGLDLHGAIASRYGIRAWPTMITIDQEGQVSATQAGAEPSALHAFMRSTGEAATSA